MNNGFSGNKPFERVFGGLVSVFSWAGNYQSDLSTHQIRDQQNMTGALIRYDYISFQAESNKLPGSIQTILMCVIKGCRT